MEEIRKRVEKESNAPSARLNYQQLLLTRYKTWRKLKNLKNYALENSAMAQENFISDSLKLDKIRMEQRKVKEIADLLNN